MSSLIWLPLRSMFWANNGIELVANNTFSAVNWAGAGYAWNAVGWTKTSPDTAANHVEPGPSGSGIRIVSDGAYVGVSQVTTVINRRYHFIQDTLSVASGSLRLVGGPTAMLMVISAPGRSEQTFIADGTTLSVLRNVACDAVLTSVSIQEQFMYTANAGGLHGKVQCGDGRTAVTFPTKLPGSRGFSFDGGDFFQWMQPVANGTYSVSMLVQWFGGACYFVDARAGGGSGYLYVNAGGVFTVSGGGVVYVNGEPAASIPYGQPVSITLAGNTFSAPTKLVIGAANTLGSALVGNMLGFGLFPGSLTQTESRDIEYRMRKEVNRP